MVGEYSKIYIFKVDWYHTTYLKIWINQNKNNLEDMVNNNLKILMKHTFSSVNEKNTLLYVITDTVTYDITLLWNIYYKKQPQNWILVLFSFISILQFMKSA